ncbi:MAG: methyltransferase domain-containing protein, partial [Nanoarchaeota archaeon]|nr:methyltransferase domain-containing protein [Nanoarchaeota archaeon]
MGKVVKIKDMALDGLHGEVEKVFLSLNLDRDSEILILGSGEGFADSWLLKNNYKNITSVDLYTENKLKDKVNFIKLDLNEKSFHKSINKKFDVIICIEIIEHVFNTKDFLENVSYLTK